MQREPYQLEETVNESWNQIKYYTRHYKSNKIKNEILKDQSYNILMRKTFSLFKF
jgi:hypothetical protein